MSTSQLSSSLKKTNKQTASENTFEWLKQIIRSSSKGVLELFREIDHSNSGKVSPMEFKTVINKLNLGFSGYEVNLLLDHCDIGSDGYIDWMSFVNRIRFK